MKKTFVGIIAEMSLRRKTSQSMFIDLLDAKCIFERSLGPQTLVEQSSKLFEIVTSASERTPSPTISSWKVAFINPSNTVNQRLPRGPSGEMQIFLQSATKQRTPVRRSHGLQEASGSI